MPNAVRTVVVVLLLLAACAGSRRTPSPTFGYVFHETTGLTSGVLDDGKLIAIQLRDDSDPVALRTLRDLGWPVLYANGDGHCIFVTGRLSPDVKWTPDRPDMAQSEPYRELTLESWHIVTPFRVRIVTSVAVPQEFREESRAGLRAEDFRTPTLVQDVDLGRFQRRATR